ncbi:hypothetical protein I3843_03G081200 [Carya illinoinensis]|nr:hypothetical protein I3843_03G081200 [Carya illinoinensis]
MPTTQEYSMEIVSIYPILEFKNTASHLFPLDSVGILKSYRLQNVFLFYYF